MKSVLAALTIIAISACVCSTRSHAKDAEQTLEDPTETRPSLPMGQTPGEHQPGALFCAFRDNQDEFVHVLFCRFEDSEDCVLTAPKPLKAMLQRFDAVKMLKIGSTDDGCSEITFSGHLKSPD
jgi:hypothetical protein